MRRTVVYFALGMACCLADGFVSSTRAQDSGKTSPPAALPPAADLPGILPATRDELPSAPGSLSTSPDQPLAPLRPDAPEVTDEPAGEPSSRRPDAVSELPELPRGPTRLATRPDGSPSRTAPVGSGGPAEERPNLALQSERDREYLAIAAEVAALERQTNLLKRVVRLVQPTVVHIEAKKQRPVVRYREDAKPVEEAGSGVAVSLNDQLYIITNRHVIANAALSDILLKGADGQEIEPKSVLTDRASDLALIAVSRHAPLVPARLGSSKKLEIGDFVLAVGSPFGLSHSVTYGIVSAKGRRDLEVGANGVQYQDFIQTDAAINPGNSGGPLLNLRGEVVGINTAIFSASGGNEGIGFALPIDMVAFVAEQLVKQGRVSRAYLGVHLDSRFDAEASRQLGLKRPYGARVSGVTPNSPAARARLQVGDVILNFDETEVEDDAHLINMVSTTELGKRVRLTVLRSNRIEHVDVIVSQRSEYELEG
ncbi:MAG: trypsin-like peptidase domain-containing protein [Planctomycetales bacterium]|nr:trypsin-like peptidase domain-containing protein [Planctomycetales bacterium]